MEQKKGCGCRAKNNGGPTVTNTGPVNVNDTNIGHPPRLNYSHIHSPPTPVQPEMAENTMNNEEKPVEFSRREVVDPETIKQKLGKGLGMVQSFATAIASRGINNTKINRPTKQLRVLSCFGNNNSGGILPPCEYLRNSNTPGKHFCGGCGCGDKPHTWLMSEGEEYSKLDYPKLQCPLKMPGFSNYEASSPQEAVPPISRRYYIENIDYKEVDKIQVSLPEKEQPPAPQEPETNQ
jgi:hypothetical protein